MLTAQVNSSNGSFIINFETGDVIKFVPNEFEEINTDNEEIKKFNLEEYCQYWNQEKTDFYDILDLCHWDKKDDYFHAEETARQNIRENQNY